MEEKVRAILNEYLYPGERVIVGISGGADSVALALILHRAGYQMDLIHINFHLRDAESDRDDAFVKNLCQSSFPMHRYHKFDVDTFSFAKEHGISVEMAARDLRYGIFQEHAQKENIRWIVVGHHADDQVETALLNLSRGTGGAGLAGMAITNEHGIFRPLLNIPREEIIAYLKSRGQDYCTDSTNMDTKYKRNLIRHKVIPLMERLNPSFKSSLLKSMKHFREEQKALDYFTEKLFRSIFDEESQSMDLCQLEKQPEAEFLISRKLRSWGFSDNQIENILRFYLSDKCVTYSSSDGAHHLQIYRGRGYLFPEEIETPDSAQITAAGIYELEGIGTLYIGGFEGALSIDRNTLHGSNIILRTASTEDKFQPLGMTQGKKKLFRYLGEKGIPECYRKSWPILCKGDEVIAVLPFEISHGAKSIPGKESVKIHFLPSENLIGEVMRLFIK